MFWFQGNKISNRLFKSISTKHFFLLKYLQNRVVATTTSIQAKKVPFFRKMTWLVENWIKDRIEPQTWRKNERWKQRMEDGKKYREKNDWNERKEKSEECNVKMEVKVNRFMVKGSKFFWMSSKTFVTLLNF